MNPLKFDQNTNENKTKKIVIRVPAVMQICSAKFPIENLNDLNPSNLRLL